MSPYIHAGMKRWKYLASTRNVHPSSPILSKVVRRDRSRRSSGRVAWANLLLQGVCTTVPTYAKASRVHVWINISPCFEEPDILYSINKHLSSGARAKAESPQEILEAVNLTLKTKKYLIVLDGITKLLNWSSVLDALPENNKGSRLVIITSLKESEGALNSLSCVHELRVNELPLGDRVSLFLRNACGSRKNPVIVSAGSRGLFGELESRTMENAYEDMLEITNGLPLAIVLLGRLLRRKEFPGQWNEVLKHLKLKKHCNPLEGLLALCFEDLPHDLRPCFLHFALRPENTIYSARRLVRLWVAEGFLQHTKGETMEDVGHTYLKELVSRGMIHLIKKESEGEIHQQLHAMARSETYNQATFLDVYGQTYVPSSAAVRHIFLNNIRNANIHMDSRFPNLRSVLCAFPNNWERAEAVGGATAITSDDHYLGHFGKSELLRVIELTGLQVKKVPHVIGNLIHLRYLCIRSPCLVELPSSIGNLINLQTLDIAKTSVKKLSASFWKISTLRHVIAERLDLPESVGALKNMQALMGLVCLHPWHGNISPLHNMVNLRKLKISGLTSSHSAALSDAFSKLELLIHLELIGTDIPSTLFTNFSMRRLQSLQLTGKMIMQTADTEQRCTLPSLIKLVLKNSKVNHGFIDMVGKLPCLAELRLLSRSYDGQQLTFSPASGFGNLTDLVIRNLPELSLLTIQSESLPKVRKITVGDCNKMRLNDLEGEQVLINLTEFKVINMPDNWGLQEGSTFINDKFFRVSAPQNNGAAQMPESRNRFDIWCRRLRQHLPCQGRGKQGPGLPHQAL